MAGALTRVPYLKLVGLQATTTGALTRGSYLELVGLQVTTTGALTRGSYLELVGLQATTTGALPSVMKKASEMLVSAVAKTVTPRKSSATHLRSFQLAPGRPCCSPVFLHSTAITLSCNTL